MNSIKNRQNEVQSKFKSNNNRNAGKRMPSTANGTLKHSLKNASVQEFSSLKEISGYSNEELAGLLGITHRTIQNKKATGELFDIAQTERLRKLNELFKEGITLFSTKEQFNEWMKKPSYGLDYNVPSELLKQPGGLEIVMNELTSIKYGDAV